MTYTTQQLQAMSDFEIAILICQKTGKQARKEQFLGYDDRDPNVVLLHGAESFDINNPSDIMPLAFERSICLIQTDTGKELGEWVAFTWIGNNEHIDKNPLRAIACLLLMMGD